MRKSSCCGIVTLQYIIHYMKEKEKSHIITVRNLVKRYQKADKNAVDDITFHVEEGELFAFLGPNGAGKTTTISILTGSLSKTSGTVEVSGFNMDTDSQSIRQNIGIIFQNPSLDANLTGEENIRFHAVLYGLYPFRPTFSLMPISYQKRVNELAQILGIKKDIFKPTKTFSGGMKRKLEIVRSLMHKPKVLFLDEPTVGLDPISRNNLWEYLRTVREQDHMTIFLTTHYLEEAEGSDHTCIVNNGKIVAYGTPEQIKHDLVQQYVVLRAKESTKLEDELKKMKFRYSKSGTQFRVQLTDGKNIQELVQSIHTRLDTIKIHDPTLEEAYIEVVQDTNQKE